MRIGIYTNKAKDADGKWTNLLQDELSKYGIDYVEIRADSTNYDIDLLIVLGGDGTLLKLVNYLVRANVPVIGINAGKVGFLAEFETFEIAEAVKLISNNELIIDERIVIKTKYNGNVQYALNELVIQRIFDNAPQKILTVDISIDGEYVDKIDGDGVIISTPTGSTAYSLSAGGSILSPGINAFSMTPICAHSLHNRPLVFSADSKCELKLTSSATSGLVIDGVFSRNIKKDDVITIYKSTKTIKFLRKKDTNFYSRLLNKLKK